MSIYVHQNTPTRIAILMVAPVIVLLSLTVPTMLAFLFFGLPAIVKAVAGDRIGPINLGRWAKGVFVTIIIFHAILLACMVFLDRLS